MRTRPSNARSRTSTTARLGTRCRTRSRGNAGDEWGNDIRYNAGEGKEYELRSAGPDGLMNTDDDIVRTYTLAQRTATRRIQR